MESVRQNAFELVVTDKNLPGKDGLELLQQIKAMRPETVVVMITGYGSKESAIEALNRGATAFLEKPFDDISVIVDRLTALLSHKQQENKSRRYLQMIKERQPLLPRSSTASSAMIWSIGCSTCTLVRPGCGGAGGSRVTMRILLAFGSPSCSSVSAGWLPAASLR